MPTQNFSSEALNSQNPDIESTQLNILTVDELCESFTAHHVGNRPDLARQYLAELLNRQEQAEADKDDAKQNNLYFKALDALATVKSRRRFLQGILAVSLALALPKQAVAVAESEPDFTVRPAPYPDPARIEVLTRWTQKLDNALVPLETIWTDIQDTNAKAPELVDGLEMVSHIQAAQKVLNELAYDFETVEVSDLIQAATGRNPLIFFIMTAITDPDSSYTYAQWVDEIEAVATDDPQAARELQYFLDAQYRAGNVPGPKVRPPRPEPTPRDNHISLWIATIEDAQDVLRDWVRQLQQARITPPEQVNGSDHLKMINLVRDHVETLYDLVDGTGKVLNLDDLLTLLTGKTIDQVFADYEAVQR